MTLSVGVPTEVKEDERRVALTPDGVREMDAHGVEVLVQAGAGEGASIPDEAYKAAGAEVVPDAAEVWAPAGMVVKVKEPQPSELEHLRPDLTLFTYLHLAAYPKVAQALCDAGTTGIAYETVMRVDGALPLLAPMSEVAGRLAVQAGARFLEAPQGGRGVLLGGAPGVQPARVVVIGAGNVGWNSAWIAAGMEAEVNLLDKNLDRLRFVDQIHKGRITTLASNRGTVERCIAEADLVIGAVLVAGGRAPVVITEPMVTTMKPGAVIVDVAIDQGGCVETSRETTHHDPTYVEHGVVHYCVGNMPGAVPATSTHALTNATLPYLVEVAKHGATEACRRDPALAPGLNTEGGQVVNAVVAEALGVPAGTPSHSVAEMAGLELDDTDKAIIRALQLDGRTPYSKLGPAVGLSQAAVRQRVQRLIDRGVMQVVAVTDPATLGFAVQAMVAISVTGDVRKVADAIGRLDDVEYVVITAGRFDLLVEVVCADMAHLLDLVNDKLRAVKGVTSTEVFTYLSLVKQTYSWGVR